jgi:hypothetical protein
MNGRLCVAALLLVAVGEARAGVGVSPPGRIAMSASLGDTTFELKQDIIGPEKPVGIIGPDRSFTSITHVQVCRPLPDLLPPGPCTPTNVQFKVSAGDRVTAQAGGLLVVIGELAGIIGPEIQYRAAKYLGLNFTISGIIGPDLPAGIIGPDLVADLLIASLSATVPPGVCTISGPPVPCTQELPGFVRDGAAAFDVGTTCGP